MNRIQSKAERKSDRGNPRGGYIMMVVVITMAVIVLTLIAMVRQVTMVAQSLRTSKEKSQIHWILESGIERAKARLMSDPAFVSETWSIDIAPNGGPSTVVRIQIDEDTNLGRTIHVQVNMSKKSRPDYVARKKVPFPLLPTAKK